MWTAIATVLLTFLLTGLAANRLVQAWQHRNWLQQQRILDADKDFKALQEIFDEIALLAGRRQHRMHRLLSSLRKHDPEEIKSRLKEYDESLIAWNEKFMAFLAKLTMHLDWDLSKRLEDQIQNQFVSLGARLERLAHAKLSGHSVDVSQYDTLSQSISRLQRSLFVFNRDILKFIRDKKRAAYEIEPLSPYSLDRIPTWELVKALFKPRIEKKQIL